MWSSCRLCVVASLRAKACESELGQLLLLKIPAVNRSACASLLAKFEGALASNFISFLELNLPDFNVETDEYEAHHLAGSAEVLGWELWLENLLIAMAS